MPPACAGPLSVTLAISAPRALSSPRLSAISSVTAWILSNLKIAVGFAFTGALVGEFVAATHGLGYLLSFAQSTYNASLTLALLLLIMAFVFLLFALAGRLEKRLLRWR